MTAVVIVPSLKVSGGIREALRLATEATAGGRPVRMLCMWKSPHAMVSELPVDDLSDWPPNAATAMLQLPVLTRRFAQWLKRQPTSAEPLSYIFTHYATLPLALFVPKGQRLFFVQDLEWRFVGNRLASELLRHFVKAVYRTGRLVSANSYLTKALQHENLQVACEMPIWADSSFEGPGAPVRNVDFVMVLRKGAHKRLDLYLRFIALAKQAGQRVAVITPEDDISAMVADQVCTVTLRPDTATMRSLYSRSRCFIHASEHEGFGLPPLEAMGSGCVALCRNSGGVQAFMDNGRLKNLLVPLDVSIEAFHDMATALVADDAVLREYSEAARDVFVGGAALCAQARRDLADAFR